jgi:hypothetical protein
VTRYLAKPDQRRILYPESLRDARLVSAEKRRDAAANTIAWIESASVYLLSNSDPYVARQRAILYARRQALSSRREG